jgi:thiamine-monophosphate kinase
LISADTLKNLLIQDNLIIFIRYILLPSPSLIPLATLLNHYYMEIKELGEFELIEKIKEITETKNYNHSITLPNGDDCFAFKEKNNILITTDTLVEDVHFIKDTFPPYELGIKSAASNLSDIAACGGIPKYALVSLILPPELEVDWLLEFYKGLNYLFSKYTTYIGGGNISKGEKISITITLIGTAEKPIPRSKAKPGDSIFITGTVGDSRLGLEILLSKQKPSTDYEKYLVKRHLEPTPRIEVGQSIKEIATSCIDISDGLIQDLNHILESSNTGAEIELEKIPISNEYMSYLKRKNDKEVKPPELKTLELKTLEYALTGGEDYELIFTAPPDKEEEIKRISEKVGVKITKIGKITESKGIKMLFRNRVIKPEEILNKYGWEHF